MASIGPNNPSSGVSDDAVGTEVWSNPGNVLASDNSRATSNQGTPNVTRQTNYLKATSFGFSIPTGATVDGIVVEVEKLGSTGFNPATHFVRDAEIKIVKADGSIGSTNKADTETNWPSSDTYVSHGADDDLWGETWTPADINNVNFGVVVSGNMTQASGSVTANIDHIRITVYYTPPDFSPSAMMQQMMIAGGLS